MCPNHAQKVAFFEEKAQKLWVALRGGIRDPMYQKIWSIWDIFDLMTFLPLSRPPSRFAVSKYVVCDRFVLLCSDFNFVTQLKCLYHRLKI